MNYIEIKGLQDSPLSVWQRFAGEERVFWYDPTKQHYIIGAVRDAAIEPNQVKAYPYAWYSETFFKNKTSDLWGDMGNEIVAFQYYYVWDGEIGRALKNGQFDEWARQDSAFNERTRKTSQFDEQTQKSLQFNGQARKITESVESINHEYTMATDDYEDWAVFFQAIKDSINSGETVKIVASRAVELQGKQPFNIESILKKLLDNNKNSFVFAYEKGDAVFLGATPEILVQQTGDKVLSYALAGTIKKQNSNDRESGNILLYDEKNRFEHGIVVDMIRKTMEEMLEDDGAMTRRSNDGAMACRSNDSAMTHSSSDSNEADAVSAAGHTEGLHIGPMELMELKNLYHLRTILTAPAAHKGILEWAKALHPTPAMGGQPREKALALLAAKEPYDRGLYAAPLGMLEGNGDGTIVVGIRSALIKGKQAFAFTGCGIVAGSDCRSEYEETATKLGTILEAL